MPFAGLGTLLWQRWFCAHSVWRPDEPVRLTSPTALEREREHLFAPFEDAKAGMAAARDRGKILCLSGGGVRSAAFSLGVLQALASRRLLTPFHWLSTVSGGGYTGAWLQSWIYNSGGDAASVETALGGAAEPPEVKRLREWCNYLTPQPGLMSADTWTGMTLWVRNVLVNWLVFGPALLAIALVPVAYARLESGMGGGPAWVALGAGGVALLFSTLASGRWLPSHVQPSDYNRQSQPDATVPQREAFPQMSVDGVRELVIAPMLLWSLAVPFWWFEVMRPPLAEPDQAAGSLMQSVFVPPAVAVIAMLLAYLAVTARFAIEGNKPQATMFYVNIVSYCLSCGAAGGVLLIGGHLSVGLTFQQLAVFGPPWVVLAHLVQSMLYVALRFTPARGDLDREWLARVSAAKAMVAAGWMLLSAIVLLLPPLVLDGGLEQTDHWLHVRFSALVAGLGASGGLAAALGRSAKTAGAELLETVRSKLRLPLEAILTMATFVFAVILFLLLGEAASRLADFTAGFLGLGRAAAAVVVLAATAAIGWLGGYVINVNRFSMHATYRNRLSRAFLGSTVRGEQRMPDPWTGFDPFDNPRMSELGQSPIGSAARPVLLPLIGITLNLAGGNRWAERKGRPFTITPLHCGFGDPPPGGLVFRRQQARRNNRPVPGGDGAYVPTADYAGNERETGIGDTGKGLTLATAMTLSGAAVSPSMGFHSRPATSFLMTLFNVRLGAWLPNPLTASASQLQQSQPPPLALLREMAGRTDDAGKAVYLSDGGHFDNLGLYEAIRRRPSLIVAVDAGEDPGYTYVDLAMTLRKIWADLDTTVTFKSPLEIGKPPEEGWAEAEIFYAEDGNTRPAKLIYIKACKAAILTPALQEFAASHKDFPHTPTADQFFQESTFESYRELGRLLGLLACPHIGSAAGR